MTRDDFNSATLCGRIGKDPEVHGKVTTVSIAVGGGDKKDGGKWPTHWFDLKAFGEVADQLAGMKKGESLRIKGELCQESWEKDGQKRSKVVVIIREIIKNERKDTAPEPDAPDGQELEAF